MNLSRPGRARLVLCLLDLPVGREMLPEVRQAEDAVSAAKRPRKAGFVVEIRLHDFDPLLGESPAFLTLGITCDGPRSEFATRIVQDGTEETAALGSGRADDCDHLPVRHAGLLSVGWRVVQLYRPAFSLTLPGRIVYLY
jgi:hypothetical protein